MKKESNDLPPGMTQDDIKRESFEFSVSYVLDCARDSGLVQSKITVQEMDKEEIPHKPSIPRNEKTTANLIKMLAE